MVSPRDMLVALIIFFAAFLLVGSIIVGHGVAFASDSVIILNEIELNPPGSEPTWVELYNPGASSVTLYNVSLGVAGNDKIQNRFDLDVDPSLVMAPDSYYVVYLPRDYFVGGWTALTLVRGDEVLSEVSGISDPFADELTWQRFPNAANNGIFEDWTFKKTTIERYNGDLGQMIAECYVDPLCLSLDMVVHNKHAIRVNSTSFVVTTFSASMVEQVDLIEEEKKISIRVGGKDGNPTFTHVTFPNTLLGGDLSVYIDSTDTSFYRIDNGTHSRIMLEYASGHKTIDVVGTSVIPEFSTNTILIISGIISLVIVYWRLSKLGIQWSKRYSNHFQSR